MESGPPVRKFYQGLIQAAVGLCHFGNGNLRGAVSLYHSARNYMQPFRPLYLGLDVGGFWQAMEGCYGAVLQGETAELDEERVPKITLDPPPPSWPEPREFLHED